MMDQELMRVGISISDSLLDRFDEIIGKKGYSSRSEGIRDAIRNYILHYDWMNEVEGERIGIVSLVYDNDTRGLASNLMQIRHEHKDMTLSAVHEFLDKDTSMDIIILHGDGRTLKAVAEKMMALKGVKHVKLTTITPG